MANKKKIIAVDDEEYIGKVYERVLGREGYHIETFANAKVALKRMAQERFDLLLADLVMPGMDGKELITKVKEISPLTTIIIVTAYTTLDSIVETMRIGAYDYIPKPFEIDYLLAKVKKSLEHGTHQ